MYVIILTEHNGKYPRGYYVADMRRGKGGSYTRMLQSAKVFITKAEAEKERCPGNERIAHISEVLN